MPNDTNATRTLKQALTTGLDLAAQEFQGVKVRDENFSHIILNESCLTDWVAKGVNFEHAEFAETAFVDCRFQNCLFGHSDFVLARFERCTFIGCRFEDAEWLQSKFINVSFNDCSFENTTVVLNTFVECTFDRSSADRFMGASKRLNVFRKTKFVIQSHRLDFATANFGLRTSETAIPRPAVRDPLAALSGEELKGTLTMERFVNLFEAALRSLLQVQPFRVRMKLRYLTEICVALSGERRLSAAVLQYITDTATRELEQITDRILLDEILALLTALRIALREEIARVDSLVDIPAGVDADVKCLLHFDQTLPREMVEQYAAALATFCKVDHSHVTVQAYRTGSTFATICAAFVKVRQLIRFLRLTLPKLEQLARVATDLVESDGETVSAGDDVALLPVNPTETAVVVATPKVSKRKDKSERDDKELPVPAGELLRDTSDTMDLRVAFQIGSRALLQPDHTVRVTVEIQPRAQERAPKRPRPRPRARKKNQRKRPRVD